LLLLHGGVGELVRPLLETELLAGWQILEASSFEYACQQQQRDPCDVVLIEASQAAEGPLDRLAELIGSWPTPVVVVADRAAEVLQADPEAALQHWLPRQMIAAHPRLLGVVLQQAARLNQVQRHLHLRETAWQECQRQVNRLVEMLSPSFLLENQGFWFTQRHMMERLYEEVTRSQRHGDALTVVLGEWTDSPRQPIDAVEPAQLAGWTAVQVGRNKRRCDVAGQYGPRGFMLLLPHTSDRGGVDCCRRLRPLLENPPELPAGASGPLQVRFGLASFAPETSSVKSLLRRAEEHLERARGLEGDSLAP